MIVFQVKNEYSGCDNLGKTEYPTWKSKGISDENFYYIGVNIDKKTNKTYAW